MEIDNPVTPAQKKPAAVCTCDCEKLKREYQQLKSDRSVVEQVWDQIERFFFPLGTGTHPFTNLGETQVEWNRWDVWDTTAIDAAQKLAASIHGSVTSPSIRWFKLQWRDQELKENQECASWLEKVGDAVFDTLQDSDFNTEIASADQDIVGYGNTVIVEEPASETEWKGVDFEAIPIRECYGIADSKGELERFFRRLYWTPIQVADMCERRGWEVPEDVAEKIKSGKDLTQREEYAFCIFEREEAEDRLQSIRLRNAQRRKARKQARRMPAANEPMAKPAPVEPDEPLYPLAPHLRPFGCVYFKAETGQRIGEEGGYYEMPAALARWQKTSGSFWGHGPCNILLPTVKYLNAWMETEHEAAEKVVDPVVLATERGLLSDLDFRPGTVNIVADVREVVPFESHAKFDVSDRRIAELRGMIQRGLHNDELQLKDSPAMTATEVQARYELMNRVLGSTLARIENDLLSPIVKITIGHLMRAGQLPPPPALVTEKLGDDGAEFNIEYQGPLARSQRTDEVAAIERVLSFAAALLKMGIPTQVVMATIDVVAAIREVAQRLGTPADLLKPPEEVKKALDQMNEMQARMAQAATSKAEGDAAQAHAQALQTARGGPGAPATGPTDLSGLPVGAQPTPVVAPSYGPKQPFPQPQPAQPSAAG